jgi:hypothetical protein
METENHSNHFTRSIGKSSATLAESSAATEKRTLAEIIIGRARNVRDPDVFHRISLIAFLAWVGLGSDGLSSSC